MPQGKAKIDMARRSAATALVRVHKGGWAGMAAAQAAADGLTPREKAFSGAVFFGAVERLATLDFLLAPFLKKPVEKLDVEVRAVLECGLYQLFYMNVPQSAAVNESVKLVRSFGKSSAAGLVNAVLRRAAGQYEKTEAGPDLSSLAFGSELKRVCVTWSVGRAVAKAVMEALPDDYDAFFAAAFSKGELCLRANSLKTTREELAAALEKSGAKTRAGFLPGALYARLPGGVADEALFKAGHYHVQGEASQFACACLGAKPGEKVLDLCAAPGGKTATLAEDMAGGTGLTSCDVRESRLKLVGETLHRLGLAGVQVLQNDAAEYREDFAGQDRVLCDVPCSGLGVLAQKPDLRYTSGENFAALPGLQLKILRTACRYVKRGGRLVYSTCTVRREENELVVQRFLAENPGFALVTPEELPTGAVVRDGMVTLLPQFTNWDGFFVATLACL